MRVMTIMMLDDSVTDGVGLCFIRSDIFKIYFIVSCGFFFNCFKKNFFLSRVNIQQLFYKIIDAYVFVSEPP